METSPAAALTNAPAKYQAWQPYTPYVKKKTEEPRIPPPTVPVMKERHAMTRMVDIVLPSLAPRDLVIFIQSPGLII